MQENYYKNYYNFDFLSKILFEVYYLCIQLNLFPIQTLPSKAR